MHFIEGLFGFAPDNGDGSTELLLLLIPILAVSFWLWRQRRQNPR